MSHVSIQIAMLIFAGCCTIGAIRLRKNTENTEIGVRESVRTRLKHDLVLVVSSMIGAATIAAAVASHL